MKKYCVEATCNAFETEKDGDVCPECKSKLVTNCPKCQKSLGSHNMVQSHGCKHCGQMFKSVHQA